MYGVMRRLMLIRLGLAFSFVGRRGAVLVGEGAVVFVLC